MRASPARESGVHTEASGPSGRMATWQASRFASGRFTEIHLRARSLPGSSNAAESAYANLLAALASQGASPSDVIAEKHFLSGTGSQAGEVLAARSAFYRPGRGGTGAGPAST
ncbi:MAG TPA: hypothetical protein VNI57_13260, partial [Candidatus Saccharimonadales bacterium]|nr:hypothetical protein [Candidatus Saccharimonadales bacterium]